MWHDDEYLVVDSYGCVELVKCKLQVHSEVGASSGVVSVTKQIFREEASVVVWFFRLLVFNS